MICEIVEFDVRECSSATTPCFVPCHRIIWCHSQSCNFAFGKSWAIRGGGAGTFIILFIDTVAALVHGVEYRRRPQVMNANLASRLKLLFVDTIEHSLLLLQWLLCGISCGIRPWAPFLRSKFLISREKTNLISLRPNFFRAGALCTDASFVTGLRQGYGMRLCETVLCTGWHPAHLQHV